MVQHLVTGVNLVFLVLVVDLEVNNINENFQCLFVSLFTQLLANLVLVVILVHLVSVVYRVTRYVLI